MIFLFVEEVLLQLYEVRREEDVGAEGAKQSVEFGGGGSGEGWEEAWIAR